ncbi:MAG: hypothetical protein JSU85_04140, partial [Candidatus Zixiibacteriota bacterium]
MTGFFTSLLLNVNSSENATHHVADTLANAAELGGEAAAQHSPEFPNLVEILNHYFHSGFTQFLFDYRIVVYSVVVAVFLSLLA